LKNYTDFKAEDFALDTRFRAWVLEPNKTDNIFWENFISETPSQKAQVDQAIVLVKQIKILDIAIAEDRIQKNISKILAATRVIPFYSTTWFKAAASLTLLVGMSVFWFRPRSENVLVSSKQPIEQNIANTSNQAKTITLPDGSTVLLEKASQISYSKNYNQTKREIKLSGQALFDVVKDPQKPFIVYASHTTTKVLGTKFIIKAFENAKEVTVDVIRGKVLVTKDPKPNQNRLELGQEVILIPNQKAVFSKKDEKLEVQLSAKPEILSPINVAQEFRYREAPVPKILRELETIYGIEIAFDRDHLKQCALTATFTDEPLFDKLDIICKSIGANYKIKGTKIIVSGGDCF
jgi:transmembrane sensor